MNINLTLIGQMIAFAVFVLFTMKYVWPAITRALEERAAKIADGLEAADRAMRDLELAQQRAAEHLKEAKQQAAALIDQANRRAGQIVEEAKKQARLEGERLVAAARAEIEREVNRAREELRNQVAELVYLGAEKILESSVDRAANQALVERLASRL